MPLVCGQAQKKLSKCKLIKLRSRLHQKNLSIRLVASGIIRSWSTTDTPWQVRYRNNFRWHLIIDLSPDSLVIIEMFTLTFPDAQFGANYFKLASRRRSRLHAPRALIEETGWKFAFGHLCICAPCVNACMPSRKAVSIAPVSIR